MSRENEFPKRPNAQPEANKLATVQETRTFAESSRDFPSAAPLFAVDKRPYNANVNVLTAR